MKFSLSSMLLIKVIRRTFEKVRIFKKKIAASGKDAA